MAFIASWSSCYFNYPGVRIEDPSEEEERAWLYALLRESQRAFTLLFPRRPQALSLKEAKALAEGHERGKGALSLAKAYMYAEHVEWLSVEVKGQPYTASGVGVVSTVKPFVRKLPCDAPPPYVGAFAAKVSEWAVSRLRELEGITPDLKAKEAIEKNQPLRSKEPLWINLKALSKAYPEVKVKKPRGRLPKG